MSRNSTSQFHELKLNFDADQRPSSRAVSQHSAGCLCFATYRLTHHERNEQVFSESPIPVVRAVWPDGIIRTFSDQVGNDEVEIEDQEPELEDDE